MPHRALRCLVLLGWWVSLLSPARATGADFPSAVGLFKAGRYSEAQQAFRQLAARQPGDVELNYYLGRLALWFDDTAAGVAYLEKAAQAEPADPRIQNALGDAYGLTAQRVNVFSKLGWAHRSRTAYLRAVELAPGNLEYHWSLMYYYEQAPRVAGGGVEKANGEAMEIAKLDPVGGRVAFATLYVSEKKYDQAFAEFDEVLKRNPDDFVALYQTGRCAAISGQRLERGAAALRRCLTLVPPEGDGKPKYVNVHFRLGNVLEKQGKLAEAHAEYQLSLAENPDFRPAKDAIRN